MAGQRTLWGYVLGEAVEVQVFNSAAPHPADVHNWREYPKNWVVGTVEQIGVGHRGLNVRIAKDNRMVAVGDPRGIRKIPKGGEELMAWLES